MSQPLESQLRETVRDALATLLPDTPCEVAVGAFPGGAYLVRVTWTRAGERQSLYRVLPRADATLDHSRESTRNWAMANFDPAIGK
jgi:hypothetical protein